MTIPGPEPLQDAPRDDEPARILLGCTTIAVVGLSPREDRDSNKVARYLMEQGLRVVPVNPGQDEILGNPCYGRLEDIPFPVDVANLFLNPVRVPPVVDAAVRMGIPVVWMQLGVVHHEAAEKAVRAGIKVVMDKCIMVEHRKLR